MKRLFGDVTRNRSRKKKSGASNSNRPSNTENITYADDVFNLEKKLDIATDLCSLCKQGHEFGILLKKTCESLNRSAHSINEEGTVVSDETSEVEIHDVDGIWVSRYGLGLGTARYMVHYYCAVTSPQVWFTGTVWKNVFKEILRGGRITCIECGLKGATIGCFHNNGKCKYKSYHLPCAIKNGFTYTRYHTSANFYCPACVESQIQEDFQKGSKLPKNDLSNGKEKIPIIHRNTFDLLSPFSLNNSTHSRAGKIDNDNQRFTYIINNIDSDDIMCNSRSVENITCCDCEDLCDDETTCACLASGRNYTYQKTLVPAKKNDPNNRVIECNFSCNCSFR
jgi:hypothetical protein